jgi:hypothetical protein
MNNYNNQQPGFFHHIVLIMSRLWDFCRITLLLLLAFCVQSTPALVSPASVQKARLKLQEFAQLQPPVFWIVDGNNVRGVCGWSPWECLERVDRMREKYRIHHAIVVWDHGPAKLMVNHSPNTFCLLAGPAQRADDLMMQEGRALQQCYLGNQPNYHDLCFITNDIGLQQRLKKLGSDPNLRVRNTDGPLLLDSTRFVELAKEMDTIQPQPPWVNRVEENLNAFCKLHKINSRRESTWQRCVWADALIRGYPMNGIGEKEMDSPYLGNAQQRGFRKLHSLVLSDKVVGSHRLDRKQKHILNNFNRFGMQQQARN